MRRSLFMSAHFLLHVIALHFMLFIAVLLPLEEQKCVVVETDSVPCAGSPHDSWWRSFACRNQHSLFGLLNQNISPSAERSLIYSEHNDGLQNYSFKFHIPLWSLTAGWLLPLTLHRIHFRKVQTSSLPLMKALQIWDRAGSRLFSQ